jgi:uncharacterized membrane protein
MGFPVALGGVIFYLAFLVLITAYLIEKKELLLRWALAITILGFLASLYLSLLQAFVIHAFCLYCLVSAATSTLLFIAAIIIFKKYQNKNELL